LLLHTLAHLLIKQLSFECGYAVAAIRESLYCGQSDNANEMAGILLYTTDSDSEGTLGGERPTEIKTEYIKRFIARYSPQKLLRISQYRMPRNAGITLSGPGIFYNTKN
jgi:hypothetical protein